MSQPDFSADEIGRAWEAAQQVWDMHVTLSRPAAFTSGGRESHWQGDEPLAYIDLETRQVVVNYPLLTRLGARGSLAAVLAHEIGHHVRFPHTLGEAAQIQALEQRLIPGLGHSLANLFYDLLVNEHVGRTHAPQLAAVYRGFTSAPGAEAVSPLFGFYLAVYEELWGLPAGNLSSEKSARQLEKQYPGFRADARLFVQTFYSLATVQRQFVYFCSRFIRYVPEPQKLAFHIPLAGDLPQPGPDDLDSVVRGAGEQEADDALREAREEGWLKDGGLEDQKETDPLGQVNRVTSHLPGHQKAAFKLALVSKHYKRLVDQHLIELPGTPRPQEPLVPTVPEDWQWGDSPGEIDWTLSVLQQGHLAGLQPLKREREPDPPPPAATDFPAVEIYLDTSGSMPDPQNALNCMTLAAQVLAASALRRNGIVRGVVYSSGKPLLSEWLYDEEKARLFFLHYAGGGTDYPFALLRRLARERGEVLRVIVSDSDFLWNVRRDGAMEALLYGCERSRLLVAFLACHAGQAREALAPALAHPRFRLALVEDLAAFGAAARRLADALLPPRS